MLIPDVKNRTGIAENHVGFFPENEPIWVITSYLNEKEDIENGLNRNTVRLANINDIVINAGNALREGTPCASLIVTEHLPIDIESHLSEVVKALNLMPQVKIYEINRDPLFNYAEEMGSIRQLIIMSRDKTRSETIKTFDNPDDKQADIMRSLEADIVGLERKLESLKKEKDAEESEKMEAIRRLKELVSEIKFKYKPDADKYKKLAEQLETNLNNLKIDIENEQTKTEKYRREKDDAIGNVVNLEYNVKALQKKNDEKDDRISLLQSEVARKEREIDDIVVERDTMLQSMVEEEQTILLENKLKEVRGEKDKALAEIDNLRIETQEKKYTIQELERQISNLRQGKASVSASGRTNLLDTKTLSKTDLVYIKVIDNLPYHKLAVKMLFDMLNEGKYNRKGCLIILKNDEGLDHLNFKGVEVTGDLDGVNEGVNTVRIYPSASMFTGIESFESSYDFVLVVDYIQSTKYYLDTQARSHFMTMVQYPEKVNEIQGLKGTPLTVYKYVEGDGTPVKEQGIFNLNYDKTIKDASFEENRRVTLFAKVQKWYNKLNIVD